MTDKTGGPAFPCKKPTDADFHGMTLRDYYKAQAMAAIISASFKATHIAGNAHMQILGADETAKYAGDYADAMLKEREK